MMEILWIFLEVNCWFQEHITQVVTHPQDALHALK